MVAKTGDTAVFLIQVTNGGVPVTGLTISGFTVAAYLGTSITPVATSAAVYEIGGGQYLLSIVLPSTPGWYSLFFKTINTAYVVSPNQWTGYVESYDLSTIYALVARPIATLNTSGAVVQSSFPMAVIANRYQSFAIQINDQNGVAIDLTKWSTWKFSVWDKLHQTTVYTLTTGFTATSGGLLSFTVPDNASFYAQMDAAIAAGNDSLTLYYDVVADLGGIAGEPQSILFGQLTMNRYETAAY